MVEGQWVLGGICRETKETFLVPVDKRDAETLTDLILKHVRTGTTIHTDCFASYRRLEELGYRHHTVNHSENFVDPESGCHTNTIESMWWSVKRSLSHTHTRHENFGYHLAEYLWHKKNPDMFTKFRIFLNDVARFYTGEA